MVKYIPVFGLIILMACATWKQPTTILRNNVSFTHDTLLWIEHPELISVKIDSGFHDMIMDIYCPRCLTDTVVRDSLINAIPGFYKTAKMAGFQRIMVNIRRKTYGYPVKTLIYIPGKYKARYTSEIVSYLRDNQLPLDRTLVLEWYESKDSLAEMGANGNLIR